MRRYVSAGFFASCLLALASPLSMRAEIISLNFEGPSDSTLLTTQYPGGTFTNAIILTSGISLNEFEFPPHSGVNVASDNNGPMTIHFITPINSFTGYFTYLEPLTLDAFNALDTEVATATSRFSNNLACLAGPPCPGTPGSSPNEFIDLSFAGGFSSVTITGGSLGGSFVLDDVTGTSGPSAAPEPHTFGLLLFGVIYIVTLGRKRK